MLLSSPAQTALREGMGESRNTDRAMDTHEILLNKKIVPAILFNLRLVLLGSAHFDHGDHIQYLRGDTTNEPVIILDLTPTAFSTMIKNN